jgi:hypothetical protein
VPYVSLGRNRKSARVLRLHSPVSSSGSAIRARLAASRRRLGAVVAGAGNRLYAHTGIRRFKLVASG